MAKKNKARKGKVRPTVKTEEVEKVETPTPEPTGEALEEAVEKEEVKQDVEAEKAEDVEAVEKSPTPEDVLTDEPSDSDNEQPPEADSEKDPEVDNGGEEEEAPEEAGSIGKVVAGDVSEILSTDNEELNRSVNAKLTIYSNYMGTDLTPDADTAVIAIRKLDEAIKELLLTEKDEDFEAGWSQLAEAISGAGEDSALQPTLLTRGAHDAQGVPSISDTSFQIITLLGLKEGVKVNLEVILPAVPPVARGRLIAYYS